MTFHTLAWSEGIAAAGTLQPIAAVPDDQVFTDGDDFRVPTGMANLLAAWALGTGVSRARIVAPSLRAFINMELAPKFNTETVAGTVQQRLNSYTRNPLPLAVGEFVNFESDAGAAGPEDVTCIALFGEGPVQPIEAQIRTVRATSAIVGVRRVWTSGNLTFSEDLPAGRYQVVGARCEGGTQSGGFRFIFREGGPRPGSLGVADDAGADVPGARFGGWGVWGEFDINQPPTLEVLALGANQAAQVTYIDLIRVGG